MQKTTKTTTKNKPTRILTIQNRIYKQGLSDVAARAAGIKLAGIAPDLLFSKRQYGGGRGREEGEGAQEGESAVDVSHLMSPLGTVEQFTFNKPVSSLALNYRQWLSLTAPPSTYSRYRSQDRRVREHKRFCSLKLI